MFVLFLFVVWTAVVLVPLLEKKTKGDLVGVSILPGIPFGPLCAWGIAALLDLVRPQLGYYLIGGLHVVVLIVVLGFAAKYLYQINRKT